MRTGSEITNEEFLAAYNDSNLTNQQVVEKLNTSWEVVRKKVRSKAIQEQLVIERTGGAKGTHQVISNTATPTKSTVKSAPSVDTEVKDTSSTTSINVDEEVGSTSTSTTSTDDVYTEEKTRNYEFEFTARISGQDFEFGGDSKKEALRKFLIECQELKMKNIIIREEFSGDEVAIKEIEDGEIYIVTDQQSAA